MDLHASLFTDHRRVILFFVCLIFAVGLDREIILTVKFSRSTVANDMKMGASNRAIIHFRTVESGVK